MTQVRKHLSPALIISVIALFVALGGGAYAALSANSVGSKQLKKNAVTAKKIKKNAVTSSKIASGAVSTGKIKNDAVNGSKVLESSLGQVPSAATAISATSATSATSADTATSAENAENLDGLKRIGLKRAAPSAENASFTVAQEEATRIPLMTLGTISVYGKCFKSGSTLYASHYIETSLDGVIFDAYYDQAFGNPGYLNTDTPETDREIFYVSAGLNSYGYNSSVVPTYVVTSDNKSYILDTNIFAKSGTLTGGPGPYGPGDSCLFFGSGGEA